MTPKTEAERAAYIAGMRRVQKLVAKWRLDADRKYDREVASDDALETHLWYRDGKRTGIRDVSYAIKDSIARAVREGKKGKQK